jgi:hypothetical protein
MGFSHRGAHARAWKFFADLSDRLTRSFWSVGSAVVLAALLVLIGPNPSSSSTSLSAKPGSVWIADNTNVVRLDLLARQVSQSIPLSNEPQALALDPTTSALWILNYPTLLKLDADANRVSEIDLVALSVSKEARLLRLNPYDGSLWIGAGKSLLHFSADGKTTGQWSSPDRIHAIDLDLDEGVWILTAKKLTHLSSVAAPISELDLKNLLDEPRYLALDRLGNQVTLADDKTILQFDLTNLAKSPRRIELFKEASAPATDRGKAASNRIVTLAVHPVFGTLWVANERALDIYDRAGQFLKRIDLVPYGLGQVKNLVFDPVNLSLWITGTQALGQFRGTGELIDHTPVSSEIKAIGVAPFKLVPVLSLVAPVSDDITNNAVSPIRYGVGAECAGTPCFLETDYISSLKLDAQLNGLNIGEWFAITSRETVFVPPSRLPEGLNRLNAKLVDQYGHASEKVESRFTVDTVAPKFISIIPASGTTFDTANVAIQGQTDDPQATVILEGGAVVQSGASFRFPITLQPGVNRLKLTATDRAGNVGSAMLTLTYNVSNTSAATRSGSALAPSASSSASRARGGVALPGAAANGKSAASLPGRSNIAAVPNTSDPADISSKVITSTTPNVASSSIYARLPLSFELNQGQTHESVKFFTRSAGHAVFLTHGETVMVLKSRKHQSKLAVENGGARSKDGRFRSLAAHRGSDSEAVTAESAPSSTVLRMKLVGAQAMPKVEGLELLSTKSHYLVGDDPNKWITDVPHYAKVKHHDVYSGIDQIFYDKDGALEYDLIVRPGANPATIHLAFDGVNDVVLTPQGDLVLQTTLGPITHRKPLVYQDVNGGRREIEGHYVVHGDRTVSIDVKDYDRGRPLVIDPLIVYSTYLGGSGDQFATAIAVGGDGSVYVTGEVDGLDFPMVNPVQGIHGSSSDAFIAKLSSDGRTLVYSTYLGGNGSDFANGIAVDSSGNAYVVGQTDSDDFPKVAAVQTARKGFTDAFIVKLKPAGNAFAYATYLGGQNSDRATSVAVDTSGNAYVTGSASSGFPLKGAFQSTNRSGNAAFVTKLSSAGALVYSTYLSGASGENAYGIAIDSAGSAYVTGQTFSADFPTKTPISGQSCPGVFVTKFAAAGNALTYSTCIADGLGSDSDSETRALGIALDSAKNAYITGFTNSTLFPTINAYQSVNRNPDDWDRSTGFLTKLNATGNALVYSTYLGGTGRDWAYGIAVDKNNSAYVIGQSESADFPLVNPLPQSNKGLYDAGFIVKFTPAGNAISYSSHLGGADGYQYAAGVAVDTNTNAYVVGNTTALNFPVVSPLKPANTSGSMQAFIAKIGPTTLPTTTTTLTASTLSAAVGQPVTFTATVTGSSPTGTVAFNDTGSTLATVNLTDTSASYTTAALAAGSHSITARYSGNASNALSISKPLTVIVNNPPTVTLVTPTDGAFFIAPASINLSAAAAVDSGTIGKVDLYQGTTLIGSSTDSPYLTTWANVPVGTYTLTAQATSDVGIVATSSPVTITVIAAPTVNVAGLANDATINDNTVTLTGTVQAPPNSSISVNGVAGTIGANGQFTVNNVPLVAGANTLTITVTTPDGQTTTQTLTVNSSGPAAFAFSASPMQGLAPLVASFALTNRSNTAYARADLSCLGNSTVDQSVPAPTTTLGSCTYNTTGLYTARVKVYDSQNQVTYTGTQTINVGSVAQQDAMLRDVYFNMLARLKAGDIAGALNYVTAGVYNKYNSVFTTLGSSLPTVADQLRNIQTGSIGDEMADYVIVRNGKVFLVSLIRGEDGIWRMDGM